MVTAEILLKMIASLKIDEHDQQISVKKKTIKIDIFLENRSRAHGSVSLSLEITSDATTILVSRP